MKKLMLLATAALLVTGVTFAGADKGKKKKCCKKSKSSCCTKSAKSCSKDKATAELKQ